MGLFRSSELLGIARETLDFVLEASRDTHPNEYMGFFADTPASELGLDRRGTVITDVLVVPGTETNPYSATVKEQQIPTGGKTVGSVHSHPNGVLRPSDATSGRSTPARSTSSSATRTVAGTGVPSTATATGRVSR